MSPVDDARGPATDASRTVAASIVIPTRNRRDELERALASAVAQEGDLEVIVMDDASTDGTPHMVAERFPAVRTVRSETAFGPSAQRNRAAHLAQGEILISLDDDSEFSTPSVVATTLRAFSNPRVGAVAIPLLQPPFRSGVDSSEGEIVVTEAFIGAGAALRRDLFVELGGYRDHLWFVGEERDYCLRLLAAGYVTRVGWGDPVLHHQSPKRDHFERDLYGRRNDVLFAVENVPFPDLCVHLAATTAKGVALGLRRQALGNMLRGLAAGYRYAPAVWPGRTPVPRRIYHLSRRLRTRGPMPLAVIERMLPHLG